MDEFRKYLPTILYGAGGAFLVACLAAAGLTLQNPPAVIMFFILGLVGGSGLAAVGVLIENSNAVRRYNKQMASNLQSFTRASLKTLQKIQDNQTDSP